MPGTFFYFLPALAGFVLSQDLSRGLGGSNGRWVSFLQSVESAYSYRVQQPIHSTWATKTMTPKARVRSLRGSSVYFAGSARNEVWRKAYLGFICGFLKFGAGTVISIVLGQQPVLLKSWRHFASFGVALLCVQVSPRDLFFRVLSANDTRGQVLRLITFSSCALYKVRKLTFVVHTTRILGYGPVLCVFLSALEIEGSGILRRAENHLSNVQWSWANVREVATRSAQHLFLGLNFWLSLMSICCIYLGAHAEESDGPLLYPLKTWSTVAALAVLNLRYCRTTVSQMCSRLACCRKPIVASWEGHLQVTPPRGRAGSDSGAKRGGKSSKRKKKKKKRRNSGDTGRDRSGSDSVFSRGGTPADRKKGQ